MELSKEEGGGGSAGNKKLMYDKHACAQGPSESGEKVLVPNLETWLQGSL